MPEKNNLLILASLFLFEVSMAAIPMALYMQGERPFAAFISSKPGLILLVAIATFLIASAAILHQYTRSPFRHFRLLVTMNLMTVLLMLVVGEITIRAMTRSTQGQEKVGSVVLMPHNWEMVSLYYRQLLAKVSAEHLSYMVYDDLMGWTVGPNKRSASGFYVSSAEGLRAPREGMTFSTHTRKTRIALVGDSFTFGDEVRYEDTWGAVLEQALGSEAQVLNYGVRSYGLDQAYLRYEKDVRPWHPNIVILGLISHDVKRSMVVYPWLAFPEWDIPFSKSRFIVHDGALTNVNVPPLAPDAIFSKGSMTELPLLEYQNGYRSSDWQSHFYHHSYLARLCVSWFPRWSAITPDVADELSVNAAIVKSFTRSALQADSIPLVVYFPTKREVEHPSAELPIGKRVLQQAGVAYTDLTACLIKVGRTDLFAPIRHYSTQGNAAVAHCLHPIVHEALVHAD